jgi:FHA domain
VVATTEVVDAALAVSQSNVAFAAGIPEPGRAVISDLFMFATPTADAWLQLNSWFSDSFNRAPALMLVLAVLMALPPLALAGLMMRRQRRSPDATQLISRPSLRGSGAAARSGVTARNEVSTWPTEAWVEFAGTGQRYVIGRAMLRIGREADNDICRSEKTVHRYHAVIRRTTDGDVVITDLSGADGNGVLVNGARVGEARLAKGDVIGIGEVKLKFDARPV